MVTRRQLRARVALASVGFSVQLSGDSELSHSFTCPRVKRAHLQKRLRVAQRTVNRLPSGVTPVARVGVRRRQGRGVEPETTTDGVWGAAADGATVPAAWCSRFISALACEDGHAPRGCSKHAPVIISSSIWAAVVPASTRT